jgi:DNA polymerase
MNKRKELEIEAHKIASCKICKVDKSGKAVPGEGDPDAKIVFLGEAPGRKEAAIGHPFVGRSGQLLRKLIKEIGLTEEGVYITSPVKYLPDSGTPTKEDISHGLIHLNKQLEIIQPELIVLLGKTAVYAMLGEDLPVLKKHGNIITKGKLTYFITIHPAAAIRFNKLRSVLEKDFANLKKLIR